VLPRIVRDRAVPRLTQGDVARQVRKHMRTTKNKVPIAEAKSSPVS